MSFVLPLVLSIVALHPARASEGTGSAWTADCAAARASAREAKKDLLLDFTGSDWCPPCIRLTKEVFDQPEFSKQAGERFVLVVVDRPRDPAKLTAAQRAESDALHASFAVNRWPTIYLADADGRPYARIDEGALPNDVTAWVARVSELQSLRKERDAKVAQAQGLAGLERARKLDEALRIGGPFLPCDPLAGWIDEVVALDADGKAGLAAYWSARRAADALEVDLPKLGQAGRWKDVIERIGAFLEAHAPEPLVKQKALYWRGAALARSKQIEDAKRDLEAAVALDATSEFGARAKELLESLP